MGVGMRDGIDAGGGATGADSGDIDGVDHAPKVAAGEDIDGIDVGGAEKAGIGGGPRAKAVGSPDIILENITGSIPVGIGIPAAPAATTISAAVGSTVPVM
jgi:hypothetical protein